MPYVPRKKGFKSGDSGLSTSAKSTQMRLTRVNNTTGAITTSVTQTNVLIARDLRARGSKGRIKIMPNGAKWRCSTDYNAIQWTADWYDGLWRESTTTGYSERTGYQTSNSEFQLDGLPVWFCTGKSLYDPNLMNHATSKCFEKLGRNKVHFLTAIMESRRAFNMVANRFQTIGDALLDAAKGRRRRGVKQRSTGLFLEWQYGWKPMANDLFNAVESFKKAIDPPLLLAVEGTVRGRRSGVGNQEYHTQYFGDLEEFAKCKIVAKLDDKYRATAQGLGLNPLTTAWEFVPWSFLVDWVVPVGSFLENFTATSGLAFWDGYRVRGAIGRTAGYRNYLMNHTSWRNIRPQAYTCVAYQFNREALTKFPWNVPYVKSPFSDQHAANATALVTELLARKVSLAKRFLKSGPKYHGPGLNL